MLFFHVFSWLTYTIVIAIILFFKYTWKRPKGTMSYYSWQSLCRYNITIIYFFFRNSNLLAFSGYQSVNASKWESRCCWIYNRFHGFFSLPNWTNTYSLFNGFQLDLYFFLERTKNWSNIKLIFLNIKYLKVNLLFIQLDWVLNHNTSAIVLYRSVYSRNNLLSTYLDSCLVESRFWTYLFHIAL